MGAETEIALAQVEELRAELFALKAELAEMKGGGDDGGDAPDDGRQLGIIDMDGGGAQGAFRFEGDKITHCNFYAAHQVIELADVTIGQGEADGTWYLNVDHADLNAATVSKTAGSNDDNHTSVKLFKIEGGAITKDYRGMPFVPIYA